MDDEIVAVIEIGDREIVVEGFECPFGQCNECQIKCKEIPCG